MRRFGKLSAFNLTRCVRSGFGALAITLVLLVGTSSMASAHRLIYSNYQRVMSDHNGRNEIKGRIQLNIPGGDPAVLRNSADAENWCRIDCNTFAVALQINVIKMNGQADHLYDSASAVDHTCVYCTTEAWGNQYNLITDNPERAAWQLWGTVWIMNRQLHWLHAHSQQLSAGQVDAAINDMLSRLQTKLLEVSAQNNTPRRAAPMLQPNVARNAAPPVPFMTVQHQVTTTINR